MSTFVAIPDGHGRKTISIKVGENQDATVCFDTELCRVRAAWSGGFLRFSSARYGIISPALPDGDLLFATPERPAWDSGRKVRYRGMHVHGDRVVLSYTVDGVDVRETPWAETADGTMAITRSLEIGPGPATVMHVLNGPATGASTASIGKYARASIVSADRQWYVAVTGWPEIHATVGTEGDDRRTASFRIPARSDTRRFKLLYWTGNAGEVAGFEKLVEATSDACPLDSLVKPGPAKWTEEIITQGVRSDDDSPYVIDTITLPFENPYKALFFVGGHDFLSNGDVVLCTIHGDVWLVSGVDDDFGRLEWKRFATGLFQPLGLVVRRGKLSSSAAGNDRVPDEIYVLGRDQITRLHDLNGDREADFYECFSNDYFTSAGGHDYVTCLETDQAGNFWLAHATQGVVRVSADGSKTDVIATGLRNPNGLGVGPDGIVTAAPQEGEWTPASAIFEVRRPGDHFGYRGPQVTDTRPLGYDPPLCWLPRRVDNSCGGQVWVNSDRWGPLNGQMLHLSFGQCRMSLALREIVASNEADGTISTTQGGIVEFPLDFESGVMRGRFNPHDGQLYVSGTKGWVSSAVRDGCLQRVRYTGKPVDMPIAVKTFRNGVALTFSRALKRETVESTGSFHVEQWNYRYAATYGSPEYRVSDLNVEGRDRVPVRSATLLDERTVFLEMASLSTVDQIAISWSLESADGKPLRQTYYGTINRVSNAIVPEDRLNRDSNAGLIATTALRPGLKLTLAQEDSSDTRHSRLAALIVPEESPPSSFLSPGRFSARWDGFIEVPLNGRYAFSAEGTGQARLSVNGVVIFEVDAGRPKQFHEVMLRGGMNELSVEYSSSESADARFRLLWKSDAFAEELVPPTVLFCSADDEAMITGEQLRHGRELFATLHCGKCHDSKRGRSGMPELSITAPAFAKESPSISSRWIYHWLIGAPELTEHRTMPDVLGFSGETERQRKREYEAASIAAWLGTQQRFEPINRERLRRDAEDGSEMFEGLSCIACHHFSTPTTMDDEFGRRSLAFVGKKFASTDVVRNFLLQPHSGKPWSAMPDFKLSGNEAQQLAAHILINGRDFDDDTVPVDANPDLGRELFQKRGCVECHSHREIEPVNVARRHVVLQDFASRNGCLAETSHRRSGVPHYRMSPTDRSALLAFLAAEAEAGFKSLGRAIPAEVSTRLVRSLRCNACHDRDAERSPRARLLVEEGESGKAPEFLPNLTWAGEKLHATWTEKFISGQVDEQMRPWLKSRMPAFPAYARVLALGLAAEHGVSNIVRSELQVDPNLVGIGDRLTRKNGGLDCRQCHGVAHEQPRGDDRTKIALGINFSHVRKRLRFDYYRRFILDPPRFDVSTKMPKQAADGKKTKVTSVFDGDAKRQFDAVWHFIQSVRETKKLPIGKEATR